MNTKKTLVMALALMTATCVFARGPHYHHHHHHRGWGIAGAVLGTAALVHDIVRPAPVVVAPAPVYAPAPVVVNPAPVVVQPAPVVTYPAATYYRGW